MIFHHSSGGSSEKPRPSRDHPPKIHECPTQNWFYLLWGSVLWSLFFARRLHLENHETNLVQVITNGHVFSRLWWTFYKSKSETTLKSTTVSMCQVRINTTTFHIWRVKFQSDKSTMEMSPTRIANPSWWTVGSYGFQIPSSDPMDSFGVIPRILRIR